MWKWLQGGKLATRSEIVFWGGLVLGMGIYAVRAGFTPPHLPIVVFIGIIAIIQGINILSYLKRS